MFNWQIWEKTEVPPWLQEQVGNFAARLLWQRGIREPSQVQAFLSVDAYQPASAWEFAEMPLAIARLRTAYEQGQTVAIWGDFDADGITATAVLWEGLGQFFKRYDRLFFYIPDRLKESHGISKQGIDTLRSHQPIDLIISCDNGCTSLEAIAYAQELGIDVIVTDHHTQPDQRPPAVAIINPRDLPPEHPLFHLSGVAVAYKFMEAVYADFAQTLGLHPPQPLEDLLDLVAIGLIADLVNLVGDSRYLAQRGIEVIKQKKRLGVKLLLEKCRKAGDRPIDISFGIAPRINAVSRMWGDVHQCVEMLTTGDRKLATKLVDQTEFANIQRKALQKKIFQQVQQRIAQLDLSTTGIILLVEPQWSIGILGIVAGQVVAEYGRPTILCTVEDGIAKGSARSLEGINLYELIKGQEHLLLNFGGHPLAGGLSFRLENLRVLTEALDQRFWSQYGQLQSRQIAIDLEVTIPDLGRKLFDQLKKLEPFGMGNPSPKLLIRHCQFINASHHKIRDHKDRKAEYILTKFTLQDRNGHEIKGDWWGHYAYELPNTSSGNSCDVVVELLFNVSGDYYHVRLIDFSQNIQHKIEQQDQYNSFELSQVEPSSIKSIDFSSPHQILQSSQARAMDIWKTLIGIAKYLSRTGKIVSRSQIAQHLGIDNPYVLNLGLQELQAYGYRWQLSALDDPELGRFIYSPESNACPSLQSSVFIEAINQLIWTTPQNLYR
ncbi:MAG: single-stranded-DNA-specific exonuclease RecJ [Pseudanabaenaceae cyanobacterium bins.39]|nr:single-stranded-DNA-specific exonuclease RecJ [Pseudanabaenaceae cyanobacterium bins.39]